MVTLYTVSSTTGATRADCSRGGVIVSNLDPVERRNQVEETKVPDDVVLETGSEKTKEAEAVVEGDHYHLESGFIRMWCWWWIRNFPVQNCVKKIFISQQQTSVPKIAECKKIRVIDSFP